MRRLSTIELLISPSQSGDAVRWGDADACSRRTYAAYHHDMDDGVNRENAGMTSGRRRGNTASNLFALAAVVFGVLALVLYFRNPGGGIAPVPVAPPGGNELVNVTDGLRSQGLDVQQPPGLFIPRGALDVPGQGVEIEEAPAFIFLYPDTETARADAAGVDADDVVPERLAGTPTPEGERRMTQGSNVIVVLVGGSPETWQKVEAAVASLP
jgi:hypothetical protein